jgi:DNA repair exonuclease SbcCD ATPase subunit
VTWLIEECDRKREQSLPELLVRRLKLFFVLSCVLAIAAGAGWTGFAYKTSSATHVSEQMASLVTERDAMKAQRDEALQQLEQLQRPPQDLAQIDARLNALGTEYNRLWELAKTKRSQAVKELDSTPTGVVPKASSAKRAH